MISSPGDSCLEAVSREGEKKRKKDKQKLFPGDFLIQEVYQSLAKENRTPLTFVCSFFFFFRDATHKCSRMFACIRRGKTVRRHYQQNQSVADVLLTWRIRGVGGRWGHGWRCLVAVGGWWVVGLGGASLLHLLKLPHLLQKERWREGRKGRRKEGKEGVEEGCEGRVRGKNEGLEG